MWHGNLYIAQFEEQKKNTNEIRKVFAPPHMWSRSCSMAIKLTTKSGTNFFSAIQPVLIVIAYAAADTSKVYKYYLNSKMRRTNTVRFNECNTMLSHFEHFAWVNIHFGRHIAMWFQTVLIN